MTCIKLHCDQITNCKTIFHFKQTSAPKQLNLHPHCLSQHKLSSGFEKFLTDLFQVTSHCLNTHCYIKHFWMTFTKSHCIYLWKLSSGFKSNCTMKIAQFELRFKVTFPEISLINKTIVNKLFSVTLLEFSKMRMN